MKKALLLLILFGAVANAAPRNVSTPIKAIMENVPWSNNAGYINTTSTQVVIGGTVPITGYQLTVYGAVDFVGSTVTVSSITINNMVVSTLTVTTLIASSETVNNFTAVSSTVTRETVELLNASSAVVTNLTGSIVNASTVSASFITASSVSFSNLGIYTSSTVTNFTAYGATSTWVDLAAIPNLPPGEYLVSGFTDVDRSGATITDIDMGVSTVAGNTAPTSGRNRCRFGMISATGPGGGGISDVQFTLTTTSTIYLKYFATYSAATPLARGTVGAFRYK